jgi:signal transduction histidine kinase
MELNISGGDLLVLHENVFGHDGRPNWLADAGVVMLGCAAALFVVAGVIRLARWRLVHDPHSALVGTALIVVGALGLPLVGVAAVAGALQHRELADAAVRSLASFITIALVLRALSATTVRWARPSRLLPLLAMPVLLAFAGLAFLEASRNGPLPGGPEIARVLSGAMVLAWLALAATIHTRHADRSWSRRATPLFCGLAIAEALYGAGIGGELGEGASLMVCSAVAVLCVRSAHLDLIAALQDTERAIGSLNRTLLDARGEAVELSEWRASLVHDASNAVAGLQAALGVLDARQSDDASASRLCRAAAEEVRHLDHLLHRSRQEPCRPFDVGALARSVGDSARAFGGNVTVHADNVLAVGRPGDVVAVLKNLLVNSCRHAPGSSVDLGVEAADGQVRIVCADNGPGLDELTAGHAFERGYRGPASEGSGLGLHDARELMRAQGGDVELDRHPGIRGARFVVTLPAPPTPPARPAAFGRMPTQRSGSEPLQHLDVHVGSVS